MMLSLLLLAASPARGALQFIGAGWGRTGTMSLKEGLEALGHRTYHMQELIDVVPADIDAWVRVGQAHRSGESVVPMLKELFQDSEYTAAVDFPAAAVRKSALPAPVLPPSTSSAAPIRPLSLSSFGRPSSRPRLAARLSCSTGRS